MTASRCSTGLVLLDQFDPVTVRVADEREQRAALAHAVRRLLRRDALLAEPRERPPDVVHGQRDVVVPRTELVLVHAVVVSQLEPVAVAGQAHEHVDRLFADRHPAALLESERLIEGDGAVDLTDPVTGMDEFHDAARVPSWP